MAVLPRRFSGFGLSIHPEKTALIAFGKPDPRAGSGTGNGTFDFLGFTHYWATSLSRLLGHQKENGAQTTSPDDRGAVAMVSRKSPLTATGPISDSVLQASGTLPILWPSRQLSDDGADHGTCQESMAVLAESSQSKEHDSMEGVRAAPGEVAVAQSQDCLLHLKGLRGSKVMRRSCAKHSGYRGTG